MNVHSAVSAGKEGFLLTIVSIVSTLVLGTFLGKWFKTEKKTSHLISDDESYEDLLDRGYDAVFLGIGASKQNKSNIKGYDSANVIGWKTFLGLLNIGEEAGKGNELAQATYKILEENQEKINFIERERLYRHELKRRRVKFLPMQVLRRVFKAAGV